MLSVINMEILNQLKEMLGEDFGLILDSFFDEGTTIFGAMESAFATEDMVRMKEAAHSMKSMSGNVGAMTLSELSDKMQIASANSESDLVKELWPELQSQYSLVVQELEKVERS